MQRKNCFAYITVTPLLLMGAQLVGAATPQVRTKEVNNEPTY
jgi:hypothetical protein